MKVLSNAVAAVPPSGIRRFFDLVSRQADIISLGVGEPDFSTPWHIRETAIHVLQNGPTSYTDNRGIPALRQAISTYLSERYELSYDWQTELLVTVGVSEALDLALRALLNPGDEVLVPEPCFVSYKPCVVFAGGSAIPIASSPARGFRLDPQAVRSAVTSRTKALVLSYPGNPTGATLSRTELETLAAVVREHDLYVISDEIYDRLSYDSPHVPFPTAAGMRERTVYLNGFSKAYAMTGWRLAYAAAPPEILSAMLKIHQYTIMCAPVIAQNAAVEAISNGQPQVEQMVAEYNRRRRFFVGGLNRIGLECPLPGGAFYTFPSIRSTGLSSEEFAERLLHEQGVATVPGAAFGECGEGFVRCSYATSLPKLREALVRMERFVGSCQQSRDTAA